MEHDLIGRHINSTTFPYVTITHFRLFTSFNAMALPGNVSGSVLATKPLSFRFRKSIMFELKVSMSTK